MSSLTVREFLRSASVPEDESDMLQTVSTRFGCEDKRDSQWLLRRHDTIFDHEYRYRSDHDVYPGVRPNFVNINHLIVMVGLPARGKTYIARKLCRYLNWGGLSAKVFSVGEYRRKNAGHSVSHEFFKKDNVEAEKIRHQSYLDALNDAVVWLNENPRNKIVVSRYCKGKTWFCKFDIFGCTFCKILDATSTTKEKRKLAFEYGKKNNLQLFFIESICDDDEMIRGFIRELKVFSPDYDNLSQESAMEDFKLRLKHYEEDYEEICDKCEVERYFSYIKIINGGKQYLVNRVTGYLQSHVVYFLMNIHAQNRSLYITAHGECKHNVKKELGGQSGLTDLGKTFATALQSYVNKQNIKDLKVWTSSIAGSKETASYIAGPTEEWRALDYLDCGDCHGMKFVDLSQKFPAIFTDTKGPLDLRWRYPAGESYQDMLSRLEPVIMELERQHNVLIISHRTTVRCLMAYFLGHNPDEVCHMKVPLHTVFKLTPVAFGCRVEKAALNEDGELA